MISLELGHPHHKFVGSMKTFDNETEWNFINENPGEQTIMFCHDQKV